MKTFRVHDAVTARTNEAFRKMRMQYKWRAFGLGASLPGGQGQIEVKEGSARQDVDNFCMIDSNATNICRLKDRASTSFVLLENFIRETVYGFNNPDKVKLPFRTDPHYVPLERTLRGIRQRLEQADVQVVVLCGDSGTGKSSLVKYLALQLEEDIGSKSGFWDGIFYFECGRGTEAVTVLQRMLRALQEDEQVISAAASDEDQMLSRFKKRLQNLNALMIIDDVWDDHRKSLVEKVVGCQAEEVKYVLTSQQSDVWRDYEICPIEVISLSTAQKIVLKHIVGLGDDKIPEDDQGIVNEIIKATDFHPLALATIASSVRVDSRRRVPRAEWEELRRNLLSYLADDYLGSKPTAFGESYPRSVYAAMMNVVDLLYCNSTNDGIRCLHLMCIMALFESPFPTAVLHMFSLCTTQPAESRQVKRLIKRLQDLQLVQDASGHKVTVREIPLALGQDNVDLSIKDLPCLRMHSLRQQFILNCAESDTNLRGSVESIKGTLAEFLSETNVGGLRALEPSEAHFSPSTLSTALCALYGVDEVKKAAMQNLCYPLEILIAETLSSAKAPLHPRGSLEMLLSEIEDHSTSTSIMLALQKVVWKYMFELEIDDDSVSFLISGGYDCAMIFLGDHFVCLKTVGKCAWEMRSSLPGYVFAAINILRNEVKSSSKLLDVLYLLESLAEFIDGSYPASTIDLFDLEVLISALHRVHKFGFPCANILRILGRLILIPRVKFQWMFLLRVRSSLQKLLKSVMDRLVANLIYNETGTIFESEYIQLSDVVRVTNQVQRVLHEMMYLCKLGTFGQEEVVAIVKSVSQPIQAIIRLLLEIPEIFSVEIVGRVRNMLENAAQAGCVDIWSIPGVIDGMISILRRPKSQRRSRPDITTLVLTILRGRMCSDDGIRSRLYSDEGFVGGLVEVIGDLTEEVHPKRAEFLPPDKALEIIGMVITDPDAGAAASVVASFPKLHQVLSDLLLRQTGKLPRRYVLTLLLYLGYSIADSNDVEVCSHLQLVTPERSQGAVVESRVVSADSAFRTLLAVICNKGEKVSQKAGLDLLLFLVVNHPVTRAHIYSMPTAVTVLALLLDENDVVVQGLALKTISVLSGSSEVLDGPGAVRFTRQIVLLPGVLESILKFTRGDWDHKVPAIKFVSIYLELEPEDSSHISAVRGIVPDIVLSMENKNQNIDEISCTLCFLQQFSRESKNLSFFLSIRGSVEAVVELLSHNIYKLVELQIVGSENDIMELVVLMNICVCFLHQLATTSEEAMKRIVGTGRVSDLMLDLLDRNLQHRVQMIMSILLLLVDLVGRSFDSVFQMTTRLDFTEKFSMRLSSADPEEGKRFVMKFPILLACLRVGISKEITDLVVRSFQDFMDLLTDVTGPQVPDLLSLVQRWNESRAFVSRASGTLKHLISLSIHHPRESARANALDILRLSYADEGCTPCLLTVIDALPETLVQLERQESAAVHVRLLRLLAEIGEYHNNTLTGSSLRGKLTSLILYNSQVLQNLAELLTRDDSDWIQLQKDVMIVLQLTTKNTYQGMLRVVQIPGTLERIVEMVYGGDASALTFLQNLLLIYSGKFGPYAPRYLLKCLQHVASSKFGNNDRYATAALQLLGRCALQNKNALHNLIDLLHKPVRYTLRAKAMNYLINDVSDSPESPGRNVFVSLQRLAYDLNRGDYSESSYNLQMEVLHVLDCLVKRSLHNQLLLVECVTGIYPHDLQMYMHFRAPNLKRERSMDPVFTKDLAWIDSDPDAEEILRALHNVV